MVRLIDLHLLGDVEAGRDQSACALLIKRSFLFVGPPGSWWQRCRAAGARGSLRAPAPPAHPFTLRSPPGATRVAWFFRPLPRPCWRGWELHGLPALTSPGI